MAPRATRATSDDGVRFQSAADMVEALLAAPSSKVWLRDELTQSTGLARATVAKLVRLLETRRVVEIKRLMGSTAKAEHISLRAEAAYAVGVEFGRYRVRAEISSLAAPVLQAPPFNALETP